MWRQKLLQLGLAPVVLISKNRPFSNSCLWLLRQDHCIVDLGRRNLGPLRRGSPRGTDGLPQDDQLVITMFLLTILPFAGISVGVSAGQVLTVERMSSVLLLIGRSSLLYFVHS